MMRSPHLYLVRYLEALRAKGSVSLHARSASSLSRCLCCGAVPGLHRPAVLVGMDGMGDKRPCKSGFRRSTLQGAGYRYSGSCALAILYKNVRPACGYRKSAIQRPIQFGQIRPEVSNFQNRVTMLLILILDIQLTLAWELPMPTTLLLLIPDIVKRTVPRTYRNRVPGIPNQY
ncbi:hypothetical protein LX36DRAFT_207652 [Colletotrichum falcatum]|nr:hypothetical protein LX36DRAFT_207652 [Colletotrichum falcatum]